MVAQPKSKTNTYAKKMQLLCMPTPGVANLWRMRHTWRIGYLKVAHCTFLMTSYFYLLIFFRLPSTGIFQWKTEHLRA